jgi:hypothetical protein
MYMTNVHVATKPAATGNFSAETWDAISDAVAKAFRMTDDESVFLKNKDIAKLIAALPFLAGCEDAERTAVAHLSTYVLSWRETKSYFNAQPGDNGSVFDRLRLIMSFKGGDHEIIERGMSLLALNMITDYRRDAEEDVFLGKYNPVSDGEFDYETLTAELKGRIDAIKCPEMDKIADPEVTPDGFWGGPSPR